MRDTRDPQELGEAIKLEMKTVGIGVLLAHDRVEAGLAAWCPKPASQAFVRNHFRPSADGSPSPQNPPQEGYRAA